jgi:uncharacterized protein YuzE
VAEYRFTEYFEKEVLRKRPYLKKEWCIQVLERPIRSDPQRVPGQRIQTMKLNYHPDTDSLYIDLSEQTSVESREISEGVILDYDAQGNVLGIDIDNASSKVAIYKLTVSRLPATLETIAR